LRQFERGTPLAVLKCKRLHKNLAEAEGKSMGL
jgi:hypothetical protein